MGLPNPVKTLLDEDWLYWQKRILGTNKSSKFPHFWMNYRTSSQYYYLNVFSVFSWSSGNGNFALKLNSNAFQNGISTNMKLILKWCRRYKLILRPNIWFHTSSLNLYELMKKYFSSKEECCLNWKYRLIWD